MDDQIDPASRDWLTLDENGRIVRTAEHKARTAKVRLRFEAWRGAAGNGSTRSRRVGRA